MLYVLAALLSYGHSKSKLCPDLMDKDDPCSELSGTYDSIAQQLPKDGVGGSVKHAASVTPDKHSGLCSCTVSYCQHTISCVSDLDCTSFFDL